VELLNLGPSPLDGTFELFHALSLMRIYDSYRLKVLGDEEVAGMEVTEVAVEIGETRNHPFEYGNYRASVRLQAVLDEGDDHRDVVRELRMTGALQVAQECNQWVDAVRENTRVLGLVREIKALIQNVRLLPGRLHENRTWQGYTFSDLQRYRDRAAAKITELPEDMRDHWYDEVNTAYEERCEHELASKVADPWEEEDDDAESEGT